MGACPGLVTKLLIGTIVTQNDTILLQKCKVQVNTTQSNVQKTLFKSALHCTFLDLVLVVFYPMT